MATICSVFIACLFVNHANVVPLIPMIAGITSLSVILFLDKGDEENRELAFAALGFAK